MMGQYKMLDAGYVMEHCICEMPQLLNCKKQVCIIVLSIFHELVCLILWYKQDNSPSKISTS